MNTTLYTGNGATQTISHSLGWSPDFVMVKSSLSYSFTFAENEPLVAVMPTFNPAKDLIEWCELNKVTISKTDKRVEDCDFRAKDLTTILVFPNEETKTMFVLKFGNKQANNSWNIIDTIR